MPSQPFLKPGELAVLNTLIAKMEEDGLPTSEMRTLTTPVIAVVEVAAAVTAAVLCVSAPGDQDILKQIKELSGKLQSRASLEQLVELRRRAVLEASKRMSS
jgi:hypothetical protein